MWQTWIYSTLLGSHRGLSNYLSMNLLKIEETVYVWGTQSGDIWKWCGQNRLPGFDPSEASGISGFPEYPCIKPPWLSNLSSWSFWVPPGLLDALGLFTDEELVATELVKFITIGLDLPHNPVLFWLFLHPFRHPFGDAAKPDEILGAAKRAEMADVQQRRLFHSHVWSILSSICRPSGVWCQCTESES